MNEDRRRILTMLSEGKINTDEAERLLAALDTGAPQDLAEQPLMPKAKPRFLRIMVDDQTKDKPEQVNIRVPLGVIKAGMRFSAFMPEHVQAKVSEALQQKGVPVDFKNMKGADIDEMLQSIEDLQIDVGEPGKKVRIFCE